MVKEKKSKSKWIIAIVLIVIIIIATGLYLNVFSLPTGLVVGTVETSEEKEETSEEKASTFTITGNELIAKELFEELPYYEHVYLESGRYRLEVITDEPVWIMVYDQSMFDDWQNGVYGYPRTGTGCCLEERKKTSFSRKFDITRGIPGDYYLVIEGSGETSIKFKITQLLKF